MPVKGLDPAQIPERLRPIFTQSQFADTFDLEVVEIGDGRATLRFPFKPEFTQYQGTLQGGVIVAYADAAMAFALASIIDPGSDFVTTDLYVQYMRPITAGAVIARGRIVHKGKRVVRSEAEVTADGGGAVARCVATFALVEPRGALAR